MRLYHFSDIAGRGVPPTPLDQLWLRPGGEFGQSSWGGALSGDADWFVLVGETVRIRLPNGTEGDLIVRRFQVGSTPVPTEVSGTGPAPTFP